MKLVNTLVARQTYDKMKRSGSQLFNVYGKNMRLLVDSGAFIDFTANTEPWSIEQYHRWVDAMLDDLKPKLGEIVGYFTLDVVGDREATRENYETSLAAGYSPIPILTLGFDGDDFELYTSTSDRIAIGGITSMHEEDRQHLARAMEMLKTLDVKVHLLGVTRHNVMDKYRPDSVDATSWAATRMHGKCAYMRNSNTLEPMQDVHNNDLKIDARFRSKLRQHGFDPERFVDHRRHIPGEQSLIMECFSIEQTLRYARMLEEQWGVKYHFVVMDDQQLDCKLMHLATTGRCAGAADVRYGYDLSINTFDCVHAV